MVPSLPLSCYIVFKAFQRSQFTFLFYKKAFGGLIRLTRLHKGWREDGLSSWSSVSFPSFYLPSDLWAVPQEQTTEKCPLPRNGDNFIKLVC